MRITKKWLEECKTGLQHRTSELCRMDLQQVLAEYARCFPNTEQLTDGREALRLLLVDLIELCIPNHLTN